MMRGVVPRAARVGVPLAAVWRRPDSASPRDDAITHPTPDAARWVAALDLAGREALFGRLDTQALLGEPVLVVAEEDGWAQVRLPWQPSTSALGGYPGWMPAAQLIDESAAPVADPADGAVVIARLAEAVADDGERIELSFGTVLSTADDSGFALRHPDGRSLRVDRAAVALPGERPSLDPIELALRFVGLPYLWAGLGGHGVDCSGFVHLVHRALGPVIPRDAHDQSLVGDTVAEGEVRSGDVVYFENESDVHHTGFAMDAEHLLHSPRTGKDVGFGSIVDDYPGERHAFRRFDSSAHRSARRT